MEVLDTDIVLGMYATKTWIDNKKGYGDGECFICRLKPDPQKFAFKVKASHIDDDEDDNIKAIDDASQIMISSKDFISMGVGEGGIRYTVFIQCYLVSLRDYLLVKVTKKMTSIQTR